MPGLGVNIAIIQNGQILLTKREDFEVWCLPGGAEDVGESVAQAAVREAREETGLEVTLTRLIGLYSRPNWISEGSLIASFVAESINGEMSPHPDEVLEARYFDPGELPEDLLKGQLQRIKDAIAGRGGSVTWYQDLLWQFDYGLNIQDIYQLRDRSGLSRREFYLQFMKQPGSRGDMLEVGGNGFSEKFADRQFSDMTNIRNHVLDFPDIGVNIAILKDGKLLLIKREDFEVWCLPGGCLNEGESVTQAALREVREEVGIDVRLTRLVGVYSEPCWYQRGLHVLVYAAESDEEVHILNSAEVVDADYFNISELPEDLVFGHRQRVIDAFNGVGGSVSRSQNMRWPFNPEMTRQEIYDLRDRSGLSRLEFYRRYFSSSGYDDYTLDVG